MSPSHAPILITHGARPENEPFRLPPSPAGSYPPPGGVPASAALPFSAEALARWATDWALTLAPVGQLRERLAEVLGRAGFDLTPGAVADARGALMGGAHTLKEPERAILGGLLDTALREAAAIRARIVENEKREAERREAEERRRAEAAEIRRREAEDKRWRAYEAERSQYEVWKAQDRLRRQSPEPVAKEPVATPTPTQGSPES
jgi:hypothetical protein